MDNPLRRGRFHSWLGAVAHQVLGIRQAHRWPMRLGDEVGSGPASAGSLRVTNPAARSGQLLTVMRTPELLNALPAELKASDNNVYEPSGTVVVFQAHTHP